MAWSWRYNDSEGKQVAVGEPAAELFPSRGDAESWLGEYWRDVRDAGAAHVTLLEDDQPCYTMSLADAE